MQETNFPVEVVIGDDFSTDDTLKLIQSFVKNHQKVNMSYHILDRPENGEYAKIRKLKGRLYNFVDILNNCTGKYIALCDGDDYWTDPLKLQKQVDFMENNPSYSVVFCNFNKLQKGVEVEVPRSYGDLNFSTFMIRPKNKMLFSTGSVLFRRYQENIDFFERHFLTSIIGDYPLNLLSLTKGKGFYLRDVMNVYRKHSEGVTRGFNISARYECYTDIFETLLTHGKIPDPFVKESLRFKRKLHQMYVWEQLRRGKLSKALPHMKSSMIS